ncbi:MAG: hypothetical protein V1799_04470 [bacterium]
MISLLDSNETKQRPFWKAFHPAVPRNWLVFIAGFLWSIAGGVLCARGIAWLQLLPLFWEYLFGCAGAIIGWIFYHRLFINLLEQNIRRIHALPESVCIFAFTSWRGYATIALMITLGITLRQLPVSKSYLAVPYFTMGCALLFAGTRIVRRAWNLLEN